MKAIKAPDKYIEWGNTQKTTEIIRLTKDKKLIIDLEWILTNLKPKK